MVTLTVKKNPFNCEGREVHQIEYVPGQSISEYCKAYAEPEVDFVYGLNSKVVDGDTIPQDGDFITVCPVVGKNILGTILTIGLMVFAPGLATAWAGAGAASTTIALIQAGIMIVGGALISMLCPTQKPDLTIDTSSADPLYSWGNIDSQTEQGGALAKTYGTYKTSGTILSRHVTTDGKNQYLNLLLTGGEGPIDSISDIRINDNPIGNYDGIEVETRLGTNDQAVIANFNDSFADQGLSYELELNGGYSTQLSESTAAQGLEVTLECSNGLYYMNDDSSLGTASVTYQLQYRQAGGSWVEWGTFTLSGADSTAVRSVQRIDNLPAGQYEVRAQCTAKSGISTRYSTRIFWTQLTSIIYDDFIHPGKVLVGIKALATSQLSGSTINVTWLQTRSTVPVWNGSAYVDKPANNAAWAAYDKLHGCRRLKNINTGNYEYVVGNVPASQIIYDDFAAWADHFAALGLSYNNIVTEATDLWDALSAPETFGRGKVIQRGTRYGCVCDKPRTPVQMFTVGNIANDSYAKDILPITDRANCIEISFVNKDKNYTKDAFCVYSDDYDTDGVIKSPTQITLAGCVDYAQAYQHGKYLLRLNKLELRTITFGADIDAIGCQYGDLVLVQHDVPQWGEGGRIKTATATTLTLDREVTMVSGQSYGVIVRLSDDSLVTKPVVTAPGTTKIITVSSAFATVPKAYDLYSFGLIDKIAKPFVVIDVDRDDDKRATISGIEYVEAVYEESLDAPVVQYSGVVVRQITVAATEVFPRPADGKSNLSVSFSWPRDSRIFGAQILANGAVVKTIGIGSSGGQIINVNAIGTHAIAVNITDPFGGLIATGSTSVTIDNVIPSNVSSINLSENTFLLKDGTALSDLLATFVAPENPVGLIYRAYYDVDNSGIWTYFGQVIPAGFTIKALKNAASVRVKIVSVNSNTLLESSGATSASLSLTGKSAPPSDVTEFSATADPSDSTKINLSCNKITDIDFKAIEIRAGTTWETGTALPLLYGFDTTYTASASGLLTFRARAIDWSGNYSQNEAVAQIAAKIEPSTPTGFNAVQNGAEVLLVWAKNPETDVTGYEVRQGATFDSGAMVATGIGGTSIEIPVSTETNYKYWIKAINRAGKYSVSAASDSVSVSNLPPVNVIQTFDEIVLQSGTHTNTEFRASQYTFQTLPGKFSDYPAMRFSEVGGASVLSLAKDGNGDYYESGTYLCAQKDLESVQTVNLAVNFISSVLFAGGGSAALEFRVSQDRTAWTDWAPFVPCTKTCRYIEYRVHLTRKSATASPEVNTLVESVDVDDKEILGTATVPVGGATINYGYSYHANPVGVVTAIGAGLYADVTARGMTSFGVVVRDASTNADVGGEIDYRFKGY